MSRSLLLINVARNTSISKTLLRHGFVDTLRTTCSDTTFVTPRIPTRRDWHPKPIRPERTNLCSRTFACITSYESYYSLCNYAEVINMETYVIAIYVQLGRLSHQVKTTCTFTFIHPHPSTKASNNCIDQNELKVGTSPRFIQHVQH